MDSTSLFITTIISVIVLCTDAANEGTISRIGNKLQASLSGVDVPGATFLQRDIILTEGVVFAYSAYFRSNKPVRFQIWRPEENQTSDAGSIHYRLLAETRVIPSITLDREDVYIQSRLTEKCVRVKGGDRLGILLEEAPGAISYVFNDQSPTALGNRLENISDPYAIDDRVTFDALLFPYDFSVAAYVDTDQSHYANVDPSVDFVDCYSHVLIPPYDDLEKLTTTTIRPTGAPGATGATGSIGATGLQGSAGNNGATGPAGIMGATGQIGATGFSGADGAVGATGVQGEKGDKGDTGDQGERGERGPDGPRGPAGDTVYITSIQDDVTLVPGESSGEFYSTSQMSLSYLIWLIVLSILSIVLLIILIVVLRRHRQRDPAPIDDYTRSRFPSNPSLDEVEKSSGCWKDYLKDETETTYSNDTLQKDKENSVNNGEKDNPTFNYEHETSVPEFSY